jgi:nucleoside-diphosphate-sugar epimerase
MVTGATGFVGRAVVQRLVRDDAFRVRATTRGAVPGLTDGVEWVSAPEQIREIDWTVPLNDVDTVIHLMARVHVGRERSADPLREFRRVNVDATLRLARQAATTGVRRFVYVSSVKVSGENGLFRESDVASPADAYAISKYEAEVALTEEFRNSAMSVTIVRPPLVYGPGVRANFRMLIRAVALGLPLPFDAIRNQRSFVGVDNLADFLITCVQHPHAANQLFLVSDGEDLSTPDLIRRLATAMNVSARLIRVSEASMRGIASLLGRSTVADRLFGSLQVDIAKARSLLNWAPPVSVAEGLRRAVQIEK